MFLHAGDLYQDQVYLREKLLYADNIFVVCDFNRQYISNYYKDVFNLLFKENTCLSSRSGSRRVSIRTEWLPPPDEF